MGSAGLRHKRSITPIRFITVVTQSNLYILQVKRKCGIEVGKNYNLPKNEDSRQPQCPEDKESAIVEALKHFKMIQKNKKESDKSELTEVMKCLKN